MHSQEDILAALDHLEAQNEAVYPTQTPLISSESFSETPFVAQDEVGEIQE